MGKKFRQASLKVPNGNSDKKILNNLIKDLRPKVYITDSSTFKNLVQELTGNGSTTQSQIAEIGESHMYQSQIAECEESQMYQSQLSSPPIDQVPVLHDIQNYGFQESSPELSFDSCDQSVPTPFLTSDFSQEFNLPTPFSYDQLNQSSSFGNHDMSYPQYGEIESLLLDMDPFVYNYDAAYVAPIMPPEVCMYDYDLSGIM